MNKKSNSLKAQLAQVLSWIEKKWNEGAAIHYRQQQALVLSHRHVQRWHSI